jgi:hypothetical protein
MDGKKEEKTREEQKKNILKNFLENRFTLPFSNSIRKKTMS